ncbi:MAG: hypothetical protein ACI8RD_014519 [Bacillariaceae sp.]|jgi:hypothetical protein
MIDDRCNKIKSILFNIIYEKAKQKSTKTLLIDFRTSNYY